MNQHLMSGCACCGFSRRRFLAAGCAGCLGAVAAPAAWAGPAKSGKMRIRIVYSLHEEVQARPDWPNQGFDFRPVMNRINQELVRRFPKFEFLPTMANGEEQARKILADDTSAQVDGYIVYQMNCWNKVVQTLATSGKPVLYADFQYGGSGGFLVYTAGFLTSKAPNFGFVASSRMADLVAAVRCFEEIQKGGSPAEFSAAVTRVRIKQTPRAGNLVCQTDTFQAPAPEETIRKLKASRILAFRGKESGPIGEILGIPVEHVPFTVLNDAWKVADKDEARAVADRWQKNAAAVIGVTRETLENSAAMYVGMKSVLRKYGANAITVNCLGGFYSGQIQAYPCLGFHELCNESLIGACECDTRSTATMVLMNIMTQGRPGYISDPVVDTARRQIIYAHCVASNKPFGPAGAANPFTIMTHSEDRQGASLRSQLPIGYMTTTLELHQDRKEILFHQAKSVGNDPDDRACRTKLAAEPIGDIEKLFTLWDRWGWHRVTCYGDLKEQVDALAGTVGWKVVRET